MITIVEPDAFVRAVENGNVTVIDFVFYDITMSVSGNQLKACFRNYMNYHHRKLVNFEGFCSINEQRLLRVVEAGMMPFAQLYQPIDTERIE